MVTEMIRKATRCCENCRIEVEGEPAITGICHCLNNEKGTGSAFGWSACFADAQVLQKAGDLRSHVISGANPQQSWLCADCGSTLFWRAAFLPDHMGVAGGCFAGGPLGSPSVTVFNEVRCTWVGLPEDRRTSFWVRRPGASFHIDRKRRHITS